MVTVTFQLADLTLLLALFGVVGLVAVLAITTAAVRFGVPALMTHRAERLSRHESIPTYWRHAVLSH